MLSKSPSINPTSTNIVPILADVQRLKYGDPPTGWGVKLRDRHGYTSPDDIYEATVAGLVTPECRWLDVGCGRSVFPSNPALARMLADRCHMFTGLDPDPTIHENPFVHRKVQGTLNDLGHDEVFDLATLRMVAEHVATPDLFVAALARLIRVGGTAVVFTVDRRSPVSLAAHATPLGWHRAIKRILWKTEDRDTFPTVYKMNDRKTLAQLFREAGFVEDSFTRLADCRVFARFPLLHRLELTAWKVFQSSRIPYPEACLLGVYRRI